MLTRYICHCTKTNILRSFYTNSLCSYTHIMFGVLLLSIGSMKGLHFNMEKGLAYGILSLGNIQVCLSLSLTQGHSIWDTFNQHECTNVQTKAKQAATS